MSLQAARKVVIVVAILFAAHCAVSASQFRLASTLVAWGMFEWSLSLLRRWPR